MARAKKYPVILTDEEVKLLKSVIRKKKTSCCIALPIFIYYTDCNI